LPCQVSWVMFFCMKVGEMWQKASDEEKSAYIAMSNTDKQRYQAELEAYNYRYSLTIIIITVTTTAAAAAAVVVITIAITTKQITLSSSWWVGS